MIVEDNDQNRQLGFEYLSRWIGTSDIHSAMQINAVIARVSGFAQAGALACKHKPWQLVLLSR
jgi:hypothetical protein